MRVASTWRNYASNHGAQAISCLDDRDLHVVNGRQRVEQAFELLAAFSPDPELPGSRAEVERGRLELVDRHRVAKNREVALFLRQPFRQPRPGVAAVLASPDGRCAPWTRACHRLERHHID